MKMGKIFRGAALLLSLCGAAVSASALTLRGHVSDEKSGAALAAANIMLEGSSFGAASDVKGDFVITGITQGIYTLRVTYISYRDFRQENFSMDQDMEGLNITLAQEALSLNSVTVVGQSVKGSDVTLINEKRDSEKIQDGISSQQIARNGDGNAGDALRRVTGVSVLDGKYVVVRGLGDRYVNTQMNGVPVPSPEPEKNAVPLNLFPGALLESVVAYKTFTPDLPGTFAGGSVDIRTKAYPDSRIIEFKGGSSTNTSLASSKFYSSVTGRYDFWGYDDGSRALPSSIPARTVLNLWAPPSGSSYGDWMKDLGQYGAAFNNGFSLKGMDRIRPLSAGLSLGDRFVAGDNFEYGYYGNLAFSNGYSFQQEDYTKYSTSASDRLDPYLHLANDKSGYNTSLSGSFSTGFKYRKNHQLKFYHVYSHLSEDAVTLSEGHTPNVDQGVFIRQYYSEKSISNTTLTGIHGFGDRIHHKIEWAWNTGKSQLSEPDTRNQNYQYDAAKDLYRVITSSAKAGTREFTSGHDENSNADISYRLDFSDALSFPLIVKTGGRLQNRARVFEKRSFFNEYSGGSWPLNLLEVGSIAEMGQGFAPENYFYVDEAGQRHDGLILQEATDEAGRNAYSATEKINALYGMLETGAHLGTRKLTLIGGMRGEHYILDMLPYNPVTGTPYVNPLLGNRVVRSNVDEINLLPSLNLILDWDTTKKLRMSLSRTIARAAFREIAPFEYQAFYGGDVMVGYPDLKTNSILNFDLRFERYGGAGELLAFGVFAKYFASPIELAAIETADLTYLTYQNAKNARSVGFEAEISQNLNILPVSWGKLMLMSNLTLNRSRVITNDMITLFNGVQVQNSVTDITRPLQGQSDFMMNASLNYNGLNGFFTTLSYNTFSPRLMSVGTGSLPGQYELPFHSLNWSMSRKLTAVTLEFKMTNLLGSAIRIAMKEAATGDYVYTKSVNPGKTLSLALKMKL